MQTYAEKALIDTLIAHIHATHQPTRLLNIGASDSVVIERALNEAGCDFIADRLDIDLRQATHPRIGVIYTHSAEDMASVASETYDVCFSNFVWEHVPDVRRATKEALRVTKQGGMYAMTVPNPHAPEFLCIQLIPQWLRKILKGYEVWPTYYAYHSIPELKHLCIEAGFSNVELHMFPALYTYTYRFPVFSFVGKAYDGLLAALGLQRFMGHALFVCQK